MQGRKLELRVQGMRCGGCVAAVKAAVGRVPGVTRVEVDLASGKVTVWGDAGGDAVTAAIAGAGYQAHIVSPDD
jgi:Au+-exporting ATPase